MAVTLSSGVRNAVSSLSSSSPRQRHPEPSRHRQAGQLGRRQPVNFFTRSLNDRLRSSPACSTASPTASRPSRRPPRASTASPSWCRRPQSTVKQAQADAARTARPRPARLSPRRRSGLVDTAKSLKDIALAAQSAWCQPRRCDPATSSARHRRISRQPTICAHHQGRRHDLHRRSLTATSTVRDVVNEINKSGRRHCLRRREGPAQRQGLDLGQAVSSVSAAAPTLRPPLTDAQLAAPNNAARPCRTRLTTTAIDRRRSAPFART